MWTHSLGFQRCHHVFVPHKRSRALFFCSMHNAEHYCRIFKRAHLWKSSVTLPFILTQELFSVQVTCLKYTSFCFFHFRAIINHFNPKIESYATVNHISQLSEDQVTEYIHIRCTVLTDFNGFLQRTLTFSLIVVYCNLWITQTLPFKVWNGLDPE